MNLEQRLTRLSLTCSAVPRRDRFASAPSPRKNKESGCWVTKTDLGHFQCRAAAARKFRQVSEPISAEERHQKRRRRFASHLATARKKQEHRSSELRCRRVFLAA